MKKHIVLIVALLICCGQSAFTKTKATKVKKDVTIHVNADKDTIIIVRELFKDCKLYGDKIIIEKDKINGNPTYGGFYFDQRNKDLNKDHSDKIKQGNNGIYIELKKGFLKTKQGDTITTIFLGTTYDQTLNKYNNPKGWSPDENTLYTLNIAVKKEENKSEIKQTQSTVNDTNSKIDADTIGGGTIVPPSKSDIIVQTKEYFKDNWHFVLVVALLFTLLYFRQKRLEKKISTLEARNEESTSKNFENEVDINNIKKSIIAELQSGKKLSNDDIKNIVNHPDMKKGIINVVKEKVEEYMQKENKQVVQNNNEQTYVENKTIANTNNPNSIRYKYADLYLDENNTAVVDCRDLSDNKEYGMFEIILDDSNIGNAKYTINKSKEKATLEDISILSKYAEIESVPPKFSSIEVIEEGEMQQNGAYWSVTKKIKVRLI